MLRWPGQPGPCCGAKTCVQPRRTRLIYTSVFGLATSFSPGLYPFTIIYKLHLLFFTYYLPSVVYHSVSGTALINLPHLMFFLTSCIDADKRGAQLPADDGRERAGRRNRSIRERVPHGTHQLDRHAVYAHLQEGAPEGRQGPARKLHPAPPRRRRRQPNMNNA